MLGFKPGHDDGGPKDDGSAVALATPFSCQVMYPSRMALAIAWMRLTASSLVVAVPR